jgi:hypothetical protein
MKNNLGSSFLFVLALGGLAWSVLEHPPGGAPWAVFTADPATTIKKAQFLVGEYVRPGLLACVAIALFQLQFRLSASGANKRCVFAFSMLASSTMLLTLKEISFSPTAAPSYVAGMAAGYTMMSRLYAVRMRLVWGKIRVPWPVWRGNPRAVCEIDQAVRSRFQQAS